MVTVRQDCKFTETSWEKHGDGMVDGRCFKVNILTVRGINFSNDRECICFVFKTALNICGIWESKILFRSMMQNYLAINR